MRKFVRSLTAAPRSLSVCRLFRLPGYSKATDLPYTSLSLTANNSRHRTCYSFALAHAADSTLSGSYSRQSRSERGETSTAS